MTELIIDGVHAELPKDFNVQVKRENPFFTKNGEYTYDITLPLTNPTNAALYQHINRINSIQEANAKKRSAILLADNRTYCNGTEVITGWTEKAVSIQIASGNSEFNYFIGGDALISSLDMKTTDTAGQLLVNFVKKVYPEVEFCLAPIVDESTGDVINNWAMTTNIDGVANEDPMMWMNSMGNIFPQPYLICFVAELIRALGYELEYNQLDETRYRYLYICNAARTRKWSEMLPGWKVNEFLTQLETLFNLSFLVDNKSRKVRCVFKNSFYDGNKMNHVRQVTDVYEVNVEESSEIDDPVVSNLEYKYEDSEFWRYASLSETVMNKAKRDVIPADFKGSGQNTRVGSWFAMEEHQITDTIYMDELDGHEYLYGSYYKDDNTKGYSYFLVNQFGKLTRKDTSHTVGLDIVPATFVRNEIIFYNYHEIKKKWRYIPTVSGSGAPQEETEQELIDMVRNNTSVASESKRPVQLAFYSGMAVAMVYNRVSMRQPAPYADTLLGTYIGERGALLNPSLSQGESLSFRVLDTDFYQGGYDIDYLHPIKLNSYDPNLYDPRGLFEIRNKRYVCKEMEYTLDAYGRKGAWTGTFYPIRISDTEAEQRWILTDGKWRDGGVWLDNGRWLDE